MSNLTLIKVINGYSVSYIDKGIDNIYVFNSLSKVFSFIATLFNDNDYWNEQLDQARQNNEPITSDSLTV
jgi:hypothetical protein